MVAPDLSVSQDALLGSRGCHDEEVCCFWRIHLLTFFLPGEPDRRCRGRAGRKMGIKHLDLLLCTKCFPHEECERREEQRGRGSCFWNLWHCERRVCQPTNKPTKLPKSRWRAPGVCASPPFHRLYCCLKSWLPGLLLPRDLQLHTDAPT
jgi:hypothetical protein